MLILTLCITLALAALFTWLPGRLCRRGLARADLLAGPGLAAAIWLWAACIYEKPGLAVDFDVFRLLHLTAMTLWACGLALGFRLRKKLPRLRKAAAVGLLAVLVVRAVVLRSKPKETPKEAGNVIAFPAGRLPPNDLSSSGKS